MDAAPLDDPVDAVAEPPVGDPVVIEEKQYFASIYPGTDEPLSPHLGELLAKLGTALGMPIWLLLQADIENPLSSLDEVLLHFVHHDKANLPKDEPIAVIINSPGGRAVAAYGLARLLRRCCGEFIAVIPDEAMSAATLLTLGAKQVLMAPDSMLGPLDAQIWDPEAESYTSVLNEVQALERLRAYSLESVDETMMLLVGRTGKRVDSLLPHVLRFVADNMRPLFEQIEVVHYNERARMLKVAEEYAVRLLRHKHPEPSGRFNNKDVAREIASALVENYPEHDFRIYREEARELGLDVMDATPEQEALMQELWESIQGVTAIGLLQEAAP